MLYRVELLKHGMNKFEFLGRGARPEYELPTMQTPRRYTVALKTDPAQGQCTLIIAMLDIFPVGQLPNAPKGPTYGTDIASFRDIELLASNINLHCVVFRHSAGYRVAGEWDSLGVLLLSTESYENRVIPPGVNPTFSTAFHLPNILNSSTAGVTA
ncbi:hypothetical protein G7Y79_00009g027220 [Physcia stellaris]|nr:hypothetical protein G7Y79_00009g027220 [Physcia stellaris]